MSLQDKEHHMNYPKSLLSIMVCASLMCAGTIARPIKIKRAIKQRTTIKKKTPLKKKPTKTQSARPRKSINVTVKPSKWFILGQKLGKETLECAPQYFGRQGNNKENFKENFREYNDLIVSVQSGTAETEDYNKKFEAIKEVQRGFKESTSSFKPLKGNDHASRRMNFHIKFTRLYADWLIESKDYNEYMEKVQTKMIELQDEIFIILPLDKLGYHAGQANGHKVCLSIALQAEGDEVTDEVYTKSLKEFLSFIETYTPEEKKEILRHYYRGIEETLKEFNIDEALKNTPQDKADELRQQYHAALKEAQERSASCNTEAKNK